ncbi:hypothetical protein WJX72_001231 [[Myrmecia] bisecta]|uniref:SnoaL-like domain-containing protein n=1 Tax=[Myrmecia] bisecta TaxID=41462 RepID=A0AAW1PTU6_9CHLO
MVTEAAIAARKPPQKIESSLSEQLKELINLYFQYNSTQQLEPLLELFVEDMTWIYPSSKGASKAAYAKQVSKTFKLAALFIAHHAVKPEQIMVEGNKAIARWQFEYSIRGCGCTGKPWRKQGFNSYEFDTSTPGKPRIRMVHTEVVR